MFINNIDPVLLHLGVFQVRYYGLVYALGFLLGYWMLRRGAKDGSIKNLNSERADSLIIYVMLGVILGGRIFEFVFYEPGILLSDPLEVLFIWHGGMSFHGALIGMFIAIHIFCRKYRVRFYHVADTLTLPAAFSLILGRIANFINGELVGTVTSPQDTPWCVIFPGVDGQCRHPSQLYESAYSALIFLSLLGMSIRRKWREGTIFWTFVLMYGVLRFIFNFWRDDPAVIGISMGQILSLAMIPLAGYFLFRINRPQGPEPNSRGRKSVKH